jgi:hypothetical protein
MKFLSFNTFLMILIITFRCNQNYVKSIYPIPSKKLSKKEVYYKSTYGRIETLNDTTIIDDKLCRIYSGGLLKKIGKVDDNKPVGYWFIFKDSSRLEYILKYNSDKIDSFYHPFAIVQQKW